MEPNAVFLDIYNNFNGPNWLKSRNWLSNKPISNWSGIDERTPTDRPNELDIGLWRNNLEGCLSLFPFSLCYSLVNLCLSRNRLSGVIPDEISLLKNLKLLDLSFNLLEGPIPDGLGVIPSIEIVDVSGNRLSGHLPLNLCHCINADNQRRIRVIAVNNDIHIPSQITMTTDYRCILNLSGIGLVGKIPTEIGQFTYMEALDLSDNKLTGEIPSSIASLAPFLVSLDLSNNNLSGAIPPSFAGLTNLKNPPNISRNPLIGSIIDVSLVKVMMMKRPGNGEMTSRWSIQTSGKVVCNSEAVLIHIGNISNGRRNGLGMDLSKPESIVTGIWKDDVFVEPAYYRPFLFWINVGLHRMMCSVLIVLPSVVDLILAILYVAEEHSILFCLLTLSLLCIGIYSIFLAACMNKGSFASDAHIAQAMVQCAPQLLLQSYILLSRPNDLHPHTLGLLCHCLGISFVKLCHALFFFEYQLNLLTIDKTSIILLFLKIAEVFSRLSSLALLSVALYGWGVVIFLVFEFEVCFGIRFLVHNGKISNYDEYVGNFNTARDLMDIVWRRVSTPSWYPKQQAKSSLIGWFVGRIIMNVLCAVVGSIGASKFPEVRFNFPSLIIFLAIFVVSTIIFVALGILVLNSTDKPIGLKTAESFMKPNDTGRDNGQPRAMIVGCKNSGAANYARMLHSGSEFSGRDIDDIYVRACEKTSGQLELLLREYSNESKDESEIEYVQYCIDEFKIGLGLSPDCVGFFHSLTSSQVGTDMVPSLNHLWKPKCTFYDISSTCRHADVPARFEFSTPACGYHEKWCVATATISHGNFKRLASILDICTIVVLIIPLTEVFICDDDGIPYLELHKKFLERHYINISNQYSHMLIVLTRQNEFRKLLQDPEYRNKLKFPMNQEMKEEDDMIYCLKQDISTCINYCEDRTTIALLNDPEYSSINSIWQLASSKQPYNDIIW